MTFLGGYRVLRLDGRGQGESPKPEGIYEPVVQLADLLSLLDELDWPPSHVVGISNGGCLALSLGERAPERVLSLAAAGCYHRVDALLRLKLASWLRAHEVGGPQHRFDVAAPWIWSEQALQRHGQMTAAYRTRAESHPNRAVRGLILGACRFRIGLDRIKAPTLLLTGNRDLLTPPFLMKAMAARLPRGRFIAVPGAHASLLEQPSYFADYLIPFHRKAVLHVD